MNTRKIIENKFEFLLDYGFSLIFQESNLEEYFCYSLMNKKISITYDIRTHDIDIDIIKNDVICFPLLDNDIFNQVELQEAALKIKEINSLRNKRFYELKKEFIYFIDIYVEFIKKNIKTIIML